MNPMNGEAGPRVLIGLPTYGPMSTMAVHILLGIIMRSYPEHVRSLRMCSGAYIDTARNTVCKVAANDPKYTHLFFMDMDMGLLPDALERLLTAAEKFSVIAEWLGIPADRGGLDRSWEPMLFNQTHDLASGVMVDKVYDDTMRGYQFAERLAEETIAGRLDDIRARIDTRGEGIPIVVFNTLGWPRTDISEIDVGFSESGVSGLALTDPDGKTIPIQVLEQNYDSAVVNQGWMLAKCEGQTIDFQTYGMQVIETTTGERKTLPATAVPGKIVRAGNEPLIEVNGKLQFQLPGLPLFPA